MTFSLEPVRLDRSAFNKPTLRVARDLLGKFLVRNYKDRRLSAMITEVEAYKGPKDRACHAYDWRRTPRVEPLYGEGGTIYIYLIYGMHWMLNFSTAGEGKPEGVLVRGVLADPAGEQKLLLGPGRVTRYLGIGKELNGVDVTDSTQMWLEDRGLRIPAKSIRTGPRIGVDYAGEFWAVKRWRFWIDVAPTPREVFFASGRGPAPGGAFRV